MFTILNRLRGTRNYWTYINALLLGLLIFFLFKDYYVSLAVFAGYIIGESFGWGDWIGAILNKSNTNPNSTEGKNIGIVWLASKLFNPDTDFYNYSIIALAIRGFYWWFLTLAPLYFLGLDPLPFIILLGLGFPIACKLARKYPLAYKNKFFTIYGSWETQEFYYGIMQDIIIGGMLWLKLTGKM